MLNLPQTQHCIRDLNLHRLWGRKPAQKLDSSVRHTHCVMITSDTEVGVHPRHHNRSFLRLLTNVNWHTDQVVSPAAMLES